MFAVTVIVAAIAVVVNSSTVFAVADVSGVPAAVAVIMQLCYSGGVAVSAVSAVAAAFAVSFADTVVPYVTAVNDTIAAGVLLSHLRCYP